MRLTDRVKWGVGARDSMKVITRNDELFVTRMMYIGRDNEE